jgi:hypothetical protein
MRFVLSRVGGVAGIPQPPLVVDTAALPPEVAARLEALVQRAGFFGLAPELAPARATPDAFGHSLTVSAEGREHTVSFEAGSAPAALRELVATIRAVARGG